MRSSAELTFSDSGKSARFPAVGTGFAAEDRHNGPVTTGAAAEDDLLKQGPVCAGTGTPAAV